MEREPNKLIRQNFLSYPSPVFPGIRLLPSSCYIQSLIASLLFLLFGNIGLAQQLWVHQYTRRMGMRASPVKTIFQDSKGFLLIGWPHGIVRYDGVDFEYITKQDGLSDETINDFLEYPEGTLWIATNGGGVEKYANGRFQHYPINPTKMKVPENRVNRIYRWGHSLLAATDRGLYLLRGNQWHPITSDGPLEDESIFVVLRGKHDKLWLGTYRGVFLYKRVNNLQMKLLKSYKMNYVNEMLRNHDGLLWVASHDGLKRIDPRSGLIPLPPQLEPLSDIPILALHKDNRGDLWIGTAFHGLYRLTSQQHLEHYTMERGLSGNAIYHIYQDRERNLWFATENGLNKIPDVRITHYNVLDGLPTYHATRILPDPAGGVWIGTARGLVYLKDGQSRVFNPDNGLSGWFVTAIIRGRPGTIWVSSDRGLTRIRRSGETFKIDEPFLKTLNHQRILTLFIDAYGWIWMGGDRGIHVWTGKRLKKVYPFENHEPNSIVVSYLIRDRHGDLWAGTWENGLLHFSVKTTNGHDPAVELRHWYHKRDGLPGDRIRRIYEDSRGDLWIGTRYSGLARIIRSHNKIKKIQNYTIKDGFLSNAILCLTEDPHHQLWVGTDLGYNIIQVQPGGIRHIGHFTTDEGLIGYPLNDCAWDRQGNLWTSTMVGVTRYAVTESLPKSPPPPVMIRQVTVRGKTIPFSPDQTIKIPYSHRSITIDFVGICLKNEHKIRYRYMLEGFDVTWRPETDKHSISFVALPAGSYTFKVQARNADGIWSGETASLRFQIIPPFWQRSWFWLLIGGILLAIVITIHRIRIHHLLEVERMRTRIATDLHDDLGSTLGGIAIFSDIARRTIREDYPEIANLLERIENNARESLGSIREMIWAMHPENDSLMDLIQHIEQFARNLLEPAGIQFSMAYPPKADNIELTMEVRRNLFLIAKESIHNAIRHASCSELKIIFERKHHGLWMQIQDNGVGMTPIPSMGNGIPNMKRRAEAMGAVFEITSSPGEGTTITIWLKL